MDTVLAVCNTAFLSESYMAANRSSIVKRVGASIALICSISILLSTVGAAFFWAIKPVIVSIRLILLYWWRCELLRLYESCNYLSWVSFILIKYK